MRKEEVTIIDLLLEAVGIVSGLVYMGLQIYYSMIYGVNPVTIVMNGAVLILVYIGIRIIISSSAGDKAKYKQFFVDWVVALCLIFFLHYIMAFTMTMSETVTDVLAGATTEQGTIKQVNIRLTDKDGVDTFRYDVNKDFEIKSAKASIVDYK